MGMISLVTIIAVLTVHSIQIEAERFRHAPCKILISEVKLLQQSGFVEVGKFCPNPGRSNDFVGLNGYYIIVLSGTEELIVEDAINLDGKSLSPPASTTNDIVAKKRGRKKIQKNNNLQATTEVAENDFTGERTSFVDSIPPERMLPSAYGQDRLPRSILSPLTNSTEQYNKLGGQSNLDVDASIASSKIRTIRSNKIVKHNPVNFFYEVIPINPLHTRDTNFLICLLHYKQSGTKLKNVEHFQKGKTITTSDITTIKARLKDAVVIAAKVPEKLRNQIQLISEQLVNHPINAISEKIDEAGFSINKCDQSAEMFDSSNFQYCFPTPGERNSCKKVNSEELNYPFGFAGQSITSHGQKLVINVLWSLQNKNIEEILKKGTIHAASAILNLNEETIKRFQKRYEKNIIGMPPKKKTPPKPVQDMIDESKQRLIYEILVSYYKQNKVPRLNEVQAKFVEQVRKQQLELPVSEIPPKLFDCSVKTFSKILHNLGYKYGKINHRDAVLFDPRIVAWRGKYLKALRDNAALGDEALPVIYTDETWFDNNSRENVGWVPKCPKTVQERTDFTYAKHKVSRGGRIIIIHAGGEKGFVNGMMEVYPVSKKDVSGDYHSNINNKSYMDWFKRLMQNLEGKGSHIVVIDNAPYHTVSTAPPLNSRKQVLLDWLTEQKQKGKDLPNLLTLRAFELQDLVRKLKSEEPHFRVDDFAKQHGHKVLRTPPYNCQLNPIELVWADVKRQLRKENSDQILSNNVIRAQSILENYEVEKWARHVGHIKKLEQLYWEGDLQFEMTMESNADIEAAAIEASENDNEELVFAESDDTGNEYDGPSSSKKLKLTKD